MEYYQNESYEKLYRETQALLQVAMLDGSRLDDLSRKEAETIIEQIEENHSSLPNRRLIPILKRMVPEWTPWWEQQS